MKVRSAVKALIVQDDKLLVLRCRDTLDEQYDAYFVLPGGGQLHVVAFAGYFPSSSYYPL